MSFFEATGAVICYANTDASGYVTCGKLMGAVKAILALGDVAQFVGDATYTRRSTATVGLI